MKIKSQSIVFGGAYTPKPNPFKYSHRAEYAVIILLIACFAFWFATFKILGVI